MQSLTSSLILLLICSTTFAQIDIPKTEVIIIGTIHKGNKKFNHDTLYNVLKRIKPDIILKEHSKKYKPVFGLKMATFLKIAKPSIEQLALQTFSKRFRNTIILPYDTAFSRRQYIKHFETITQAYYDSLYNIKKTISDSMIFADFAKKHNNYHGFIDTSTLSRINQKDIIDKSRELHYLKENVILLLGKKYITDSLLVTKFYNENQFWYYRNEYMVNKVLQYSKQFSGKRIVILTGLSHKYYLRDKLSETKNNTIKIIEFWDESLGFVQPAF